MLSGTSVLGAALVSWSGSDGIVRLKFKKEQPLRPLIRSSCLDPVNRQINILSTFSNYKLYHNIFFFLDYNLRINSGLWATVDRSFIR